MHIGLSLRTAIHGSLDLCCLSFFFVQTAFVRLDRSFTFEPSTSDSALRTSHFISWLRRPDRDATAPPHAARPQTEAWIWGPESHASRIDSSQQLPTTKTPHSRDAFAVSSNFRDWVLRLRPFPVNLHWPKSHFCEAHRIVADAPSGSSRDGISPKSRPKRAAVDGGGPES